MQRPFLRKEHLNLSPENKVTFNLSVLTDGKEPVQASLNEKWSRARAYTFPATTLQILGLWPTGGVMFDIPSDNEP